MDTTVSADDQAAWRELAAHSAADTLATTAAQLSGCVRTASPEASPAWGRPLTRYSTHTLSCCVMGRAASARSKVRRAVVTSFISISSCAVEQSSNKKTRDQACIIWLGISSTFASDNCCSVQCSCVCLPLLLRPGSRLLPARERCQAVQAGGVRRYKRPSCCHTCRYMSHTRGILCIVTRERSKVLARACSAGCLGGRPRTAATRSLRYACHSCRTTGTQAGGCQKGRTGSGGMAAVADEQQLTDIKAR